VSTIETQIPCGWIGFFPWSRFHWLVILSLGITWILDGLEVTLVGAISGILGAPERLALHPPRSACSLRGTSLAAVPGALVFGWATDRFGRRKLFFITLIIYLSGVMLTATAWNLWSFCLFRFLTGAASAANTRPINSAIDELSCAPARPVT